MNNAELLKLCDELSKSAKHLLSLLNKVDDLNNDLITKLDKKCADKPCSLKDQMLDWEIKNDSHKHEKLK